MSALDLLTPFLHFVHFVTVCVFLTIFQGGRIDLRTRRPRPGPVEGLDHHSVLSKLLEVVKGVYFAVSSRFHLHDTILAVAAWAIFSVANLVAADKTVLQLLLRCLERDALIKLKWTHQY